MNNRPVRVMIVDDSALVRQTLREILEADPGIEVMATAPDPYLAVKKMKDDMPDVMTLDVEMPRMDGLTFLGRIMHQHPLPVVICSALTEKNSDLAVRAMEQGAVDVISKPRLGVKQFFHDAQIQIVDVVKAAARVDLAKKRIKMPAPKPEFKALDRGRPPVAPKLTADAVLAAARPGQGVFQTTDKVVVVGASTGGTEALRVFLEAMPLDAPGIVVVQHMPEHFTSAFARRLDGLCGITIKEAADGDPVLRGQALIAPGNRHTLLMRSGARYMVQIKDGPLVSRHRPSVDVLFRSAARYAGANAIGVIMTGMGDDGARGMAEMHETGACTIAQDEASCVVYGMPGEAVKHGGVDRVLPLADIAGEVIRIYKKAQRGHEA
ncbi:MAG: protein-glutamate methylesterase/protein-glutamine glutaminase [Thermodesulfobacteriota bacterium]